jgi:uncharacterized protein YbaP (TraB family)
MRSRSLVALALALAACGPRTTFHTTSAGTIEHPDVDAGPAPVVETQLPVHAWLWRISGGDAASPSYVLGTMHVGIRLADALPHPFDEHLHEARALVMEVDMNAAREAMTAAAQTTTRRRGPTLDRALGRESWPRLTAELEGIADPEVLRRMPPGQVLLYLEQVRLAEVEAAEEGREPIRGMPSSARLDLTIYDWAVAQGMPIVALETPEQAMHVLDAAPEAETLASLHEMIDDPTQARERVAGVRGSYLSFDEEALQRRILDEMTPAEHDALFVQRNRAWDAALVAQIQQGNAFVAVGVGHLLGEGSVLEALRAHGYTVERLGE